MKQSEDTIAVITAAIIAFLGGKTNIEIKSIRRVPNNTNAWTLAGRLSLMRGWNRR